MWRKLLISGVIAGLVLPAAVFAQENEENSEDGDNATFKDLVDEAPDVETVGDEATEEGGSEEDAEEEELTDEQHKQVRQNLNKTAQIYGDVLQGEPDRRREAVNQNLKYVTKRLKNARKNQKQVEKNHKQLQEIVSADLQEIEDQDLPEEEKNKQMRDLYNRYEGRLRLLETRKEELKSEIERLQERKTTLESEKQSLAKTGGGEDEEPGIRDKVDDFLEEQREDKATEYEVQ